MAITFIGSYVGTHAATSAQTINFSLLRNESNAAPTLLEGDVVLVAVNNASTVNRPEGALTPSGYTASITSLYANDSNDVNLQVAYKVMGVTPDTTVAIPASNATTAGVAYAIYVFRGLDNTTPLDVNPAVASATNSGKANAPPITPATDGAWIFVVGAAAVAAGAVFTNAGDLSATTNHFRSATITTTTNDANIVGGIKTDWVSGEFNPIVFGGSTTTNTGSWAAVTIALRPFVIPAQFVEPDLFTNDQTFHSPAITVGAATLAATLLANEQIFYDATVESAAAGTDLTPSLFTNSQTFYAPALAASNAITPALYDNSNQFYIPAATATNTLAPALYTNTNVFYTAILSQSGGPQTLSPALLTNTQTFYAPAVTATRVLAPSLFANSQTFYGPAATNINIIVPPMFADSDFIFPPVVTQPGAPQALTASLFTNTNTFFAPTVVDPPVQPILGSGSLVRPRKKFRPAILVDFEEPEIVLPDASAKAVIGNFSVTVELGSVIGTSPDPINSRTSLAFTQIETYMLGVRAESSWNDPSDEELLFILDFALD